MSQKEAIAQALVAKLENVGSLRKVWRRLVELRNGKLQIASSEMPAAVLVEDSFSSEPIGGFVSGRVYSFDEKNITVRYLCVVYCQGRDDAQQTLNAIELDICAALEADQTLDGNASQVLVTGAERSDAGAVLLSTIDITVQYIHNPATL